MCSVQATTNTTTGQSEEEQQISQHGKNTCKQSIKVESDNPFPTTFYNTPFCFFLFDLLLLRIINSCYGLMYYVPQGCNSILSIITHMYQCCALHNYWHPTKTSKTLTYRKLYLKMFFPPKQKRFLLSAFFLQKPGSNIFCTFTIQLISIWIYSTFSNGYCHKAAFTGTRI